MSQIKSSVIENKFLVKIGASLTNFALKNQIITNPEGLLSKKKTIEFRKNRLFAFMDTQNFSTLKSL